MVNWVVCYSCILSWDSSACVDGGCVCGGDEPKWTAGSIAQAWDSPLDYGPLTNWKCLWGLHCCSVCHSNFEMLCIHINSLASRFCVYCCTSYLECLSCVYMCLVRDSTKAVCVCSRNDLFWWVAYVLWVTCAILIL